MRVHKNCKGCQQLNKVRAKGRSIIVGCKLGYKNQPIRRNNEQQIVKHWKPLEPCEKTRKRVMV
jgi:hypothetical protein